MMPLLTIKTEQTCAVPLASCGVFILHMQNQEVGGEPSIVWLDRFPKNQFLGGTSCLALIISGVRKNHFHLICRYSRRNSVLK